MGHSILAKPPAASSAASPPPRRCRTSTCCKARWRKRALRSRRFSRGLCARAPTAPFRRRREPGAVRDGAPCIFGMYIPFPVVVGFTAGIAAIMFASQIKELLGLDLAREPAALAPKLTALAGAIGTLRPATAALSL